MPTLAEVEMRLMVLLGLCASLTGCVLQGITLEQPATTDRLPGFTSQPATSIPVESSLPLYIWNNAQRRYEIHLIDPATGGDMPGFLPLIVSNHTDLTGSNILSASHQKLAVVAVNGEYCYPIGRGTSCTGRADTLHIINRRIWHQVTIALPGKGWVGSVFFSPNENNLVLILNETKTSTVMLIDTSTGKLITQQTIPFQPSVSGYTHNGIVVFGQPLGSKPGISKPDSPRILLLDAKTLEVKWEQTLPNIVSGDWCLKNCDASFSEETFASWVPAVVLSTERDQLYIIHANEDQLTTVDFNARTVHTIEIQEKRSFLDIFMAWSAGVAKAKGNSNGVFKTGVLSPDGTRLYVIGQTMNSIPAAEEEPQETEQSLGVEVIDVDRGQRLSRADVEASWIKFTPDGTHLLLGRWAQRGIHVLDAGSLESVVDIKKWDLVSTLEVTGQPMILVSQSDQAQTQLAILDPITFATSHSWSLNTSYASWVSTP